MAESTFSKIAIRSQNCSSILGRSATHRLPSEAKCSLRFRNSLPCALRHSRHASLVHEPRLLPRLSAQLAASRALPPTRAMKDDLPSKTACLVAAYRGLAAHLPPKLASLAPDPYGVRLAGWPYTAVDALARLPLLGRLIMNSLFRPGSCAMAARTRVIDDAVRAAVSRGTRQVLILGAGLDARSLRLSNELHAEVTFFEVDHPASQKAKRMRLARMAVPQNALRNVRYIAHDFEANGEEPLAGKLASQSFDATRPALVILEGVLMYLTPETVAATFELVSTLCAARSTVAFTYITRAPPPTGMVDRSRLLYTRPFLFWLRFVAHEPWTFWGWASNEQLSQFLEHHRFRLAWCDSYIQVARRSAGLTEDELSGTRLWREHCAVAERM